MRLTCTSHHLLGFHPHSRLREFITTVKYVVVRSHYFPFSLFCVICHRGVYCRLAPGTLSPSLRFNDYVASTLRVAMTSGRSHGAAGHSIKLFSTRKNVLSTPQPVAHPVYHLSHQTCSNSTTTLDTAEKIMYILTVWLARLPARQNSFPDE